MISTWSTLLNTTSSQLPALLLSVFFSSSVVGFYSLGHRILSMPMSLIGAAIGQVFFQRAAIAKKEGTISLLVDITFRRLLMIGLFPMLLLTVIGKDFCIVVFGLNWSEAGVYIQIMSLWIFMQFISAPLASLINIFEKLEVAFFIQLFLLATRFLSLFLGGVFDSVYLTLLLFTASGVIIYGYLFIWILIISGNSFTRYIVLIGNNSLYFLPLGLLLVIMKLYKFESRDVLLVSLAIVLLYYIYSFDFLNYSFNKTRT